jgi:hypothetical protein
VFTKQLKKHLCLNAAGNNQMFGILWSNIGVHIVILIKTNALTRQTGYSGREPLAELSSMHALYRYL